MYKLTQEQINKTTLLLKQKQKQNTTIISTSFVQRVAWVIETKDYNKLDEKQIVEQYNKLRKQLQNMNVDVERAVQKVDFRIVKKNKFLEHDPIKTLEINDKEVQNNNAILERLRKQNLQLQKRLSAVTTNSKDDIEQQIINTKLQIQKIKNKIKQLKLKNKNIGQSIVNTEDIYEQIKRLQNQKQVNDRKKMKLQAKTQLVYQQISASELKLQQINDNFLIAQNFFSQYDGKNQQNQQQKCLQLKYQHTKHCVQVLHRKNQSINNSKQQKYHIFLKSLQTQINKSNLLQQKTASIQLQIIHCKKLIAEYQQIYKQHQTKRQILNQQPVFFTQFQNQPIQRNDKNTKNTKNNKQQKINLNNIHSSQRNKTQNKENVSDDKKINIKPNQHNQHDNKTKQKERLPSDLEQQQDIIVQLDQKFKYKTKTNMTNSRYNQKQTQIGQNVPEDIVDEDEEIVDFKSKVSQQKLKRKSKQDFNIIKDIDHIKSKLQKMDFMKNNSQSFD